ncbi:MAG: phosphatase PAP2 family protein [Bacteroidales bacterium]|nr:phosphatase PAP2 family protein [Bacteroidales bacterium]
MLAHIASLDQSIFLFFNGLHCPWADFVFYWISDRFVWIPLYAVLAFFLIKKYKKKVIPLLLSLIICITLTDQSCNIIKKTVQRPRPSHEVALCGQVHLVAKPDGTLYTGGPYGFPSSHAANSLAMALFIIFYLGKNKKWTLFLMIFWAFLLSYSRIYLGVHYPGDIITGWVIGGLFAILCRIALRRIFSIT